MFSFLEKMFSFFSQNKENPGFFYVLAVKSSENTVKYWCKAVEPCNLPALGLWPLSGAPAKAWWHHELLNRLEWDHISCICTHIRRAAGFFIIGA